MKKFYELDAKGLIKKITEQIETDRDNLNKILAKDYAEFESKISSMSLEELQEKEKEVLAKLDDIDKILKEVEYELPEKVGKLSKDDIASKIISLLDKLEVEWSYVPGIYDMYIFWQNPPRKIKFGIFDSILRLLGGLKFKGFDEIDKIVKINDYFKYNHDSYTCDTGALVFLSKIHSRILDELQLHEPVTNQTPEQ